MKAAGALASEHPGLRIQTHLSENLAEVEYTLSLYPSGRDYLGVYEAHGLLGTRSLMGHAIHLRPREIARMAETGTRAVFCPTSNLFLGSGCSTRWVSARQASCPASRRMSAAGRIIRNCRR
jgi:guanine deaminase